MDDTPDANVTANVTSTAPEVPTVASPDASPNPSSALPAARPAPPNPTQAMPPSQPTQAPPSPQQIQTNHDTFLGKAVKALLGSQNEYSYDPSGKLVVTPVQEKPGQLFRGILAGAIMGGAAGSQRKSFAQGLASGGAEGLANVQNQDLQRRQQAKENQEMQWKSQKEQREADTFKTDQEMRKAQTAMYNAQVVKEHMLIQNTDMANHKLEAEAGAAYLEPLLKANGGVYYKKDVPEHEMVDLQKSDPRFGEMKWRPTGWDIGDEFGNTKDKEGNQLYHLTYSAVDPSTIKDVPISQDLVKQAKEDGYDKTNPNGYAQLKKLADNGGSLPYDQFQFYDHELIDSKTKQTQRTMQGLDVKAKEAEIKARTQEATKIALEINRLNKDAKDQKEIDDSLNKLAESGGDPNVLDPKAAIKISGFLEKSVSTLDAEIKEDLTAEKQSDEDGDKEGVRTYHEAAKEKSLQRDSLNNYRNRGLGIKTGATPKAGDQVAPGVGEKGSGVVLSDVDESGFSKPVGRGAAVTQIPGMTAEASTTVLKDLNALKIPKERKDYISKLPIKAEDKQKLTSAALVGEKEPQEKMVSMMTSDNKSASVPESKVQTALDSGWITVKQ